MCEFLLKIITLITGLGILTTLWYEISIRIDQLKKYGQCKPLAVSVNDLGCWTWLTFMGVTMIIFSLRIIILDFWNAMHTLFI